MTTKDDIGQLFRTHFAAMYRLAMLILLTVGGEKLIQAHSKTE